MRPGLACAVEFAFGILIVFVRGTAVSPARSWKMHNPVTEMRLSATAPRATAGKAGELDQ